MPNGPNCGTPSSSSPEAVSCGAKLLFGGAQRSTLVLWHAREPRKTGSHRQLHLKLRGSI
eukprot:5795761-Alexandrium_andersonii.AAC.1